MGLRSDFEARLCAHPEAEFAPSLEGICGSLRSLLLGCELLSVFIISPASRLVSGRGTENYVGIFPPGYNFFPAHLESGDINIRARRDLWILGLALMSTLSPSHLAAGLEIRSSRLYFQPNISGLGLGTPQHIRVQESLKHDSSVCLQKKLRPREYNGLTQTHTAALRFLNSF